MKFSQALRGTRAEKGVTFPGATTPDGTPLALLVRPLTVAENSDVLAGAVAFAKGKGATDPQPGDELYELGRMQATLAVACLDVDSPPAARAPFFDGQSQVAEISVETLAFLYEHQTLWQAECSPYARDLSDAELSRMVSEVTAPGGDGAFLRLSPHMRWIFTRSLASLASRLLAPKSSSSSTSDDGGTSSPSTDTLPPPPEASSKSGST